MLNVNYTQAIYSVFKKKSVFISHLEQTFCNEPRFIIRNCNSFNDYTARCTNEQRMLTASETVREIIAWQWYLVSSTRISLMNEEKKGWGRTWSMIRRDVQNSQSYDGDLSRDDQAIIRGVACLRFFLLYFFSPAIGEGTIHSTGAGTTADEYGECLGSPSSSTGRKTRNACPLGVFFRYREDTRKNSSTPGDSYRRLFIACTMYG